MIVLWINLVVTTVSIALLPWAILTILEAEVFK